MAEQTYKSHIKLGSKVKDRITGFEGIVTGLAFYLTGCCHAGIQPQGLKDGKTIDLEWFDTSKLEIIDPESIMEKAKEDGPSGPEPIPQRIHY